MQTSTPSWPGPARSLLSAAGLLLILALAPGPAQAAAPDASLLRQQHPWARFPARSWKKVRIQTELLDDAGRITNSSITETTTTLQRVDDAGIVLRVENLVELADKRFKTQPREVAQGFYGESHGQNVQLLAAGAGSLTIEGKAISCETQSVQIKGADQTVTTRVYFTGAVSPYVLRHESKASGNTAATSYEHRVDVLAVEMPYLVMSRIKPAALRKTVHSDAQGSTVTFEIVVSEVPGGVVAHYSKEMDARGRVISRSTLELVDYSVADGGDLPPDLGRRRMLGRDRWRHWRR